MQQHSVVSREDWVAARKAHLAKEKEFSRLRDELSAERRALPWVKIDKAYVFDAPEGRQTLSDLFGPNSQLIVYHFMFGPGAKAGCPACSFIADHMDSANLHLAHHDVSLVAVSRAKLAEFEPYKRRMGWHFRWVSSDGSDFNYDFGVSHTKEQIQAGAARYNYKLMESGNGGELPGISVFFKDDAGDVFHSYSSYARGLDMLIGAYNYLDITPRGRNEAKHMDWMRRHDEYDGAPKKGAPASPPSC